MLHNSFIGAIRHAIKKPSSLPLNYATASRPHTDNQTSKGYRGTTPPPTIGHDPKRNRQGITPSNE